MKITQDSIINVSHEVTKACGTNNGIWFFGDRFKIEDELIIGFSPTNYHCFLICGEYEFHPRFSINPCKLTKSRKDNIRAAFFIRIKNIPKADLLAFQQYLISLEGKRTVTCHQGLLYILYKAMGFRIPNHSIFKTTPKSFYSGIIEKGIVDKSNKPLELEVYSHRNKSIEMILKDADMINLKFGWVFTICNMWFYVLKLFKSKVLVN